MTLSSSRERDFGQRGATAKGTCSNRTTRPRLRPSRHPRNHNLRERDRQRRMVYYVIRRFFFPEPPAVLVSLPPAPTQNTVLEKNTQHQTQTRTRVFVLATAEVASDPPAVPAKFRTGRNPRPRRRERGPS